MAQDATPSTVGVRELRRNLPLYLDRAHLTAWLPPAWRYRRDDRCAISPGPCPYVSIGLSACVAEPYTGVTAVLESAATAAGDDHDDRG